MSLERREVEGAPSVFQQHPDRLKIGTVTLIGMGKNAVRPPGSRGKIAWMAGHRRHENATVRFIHGGLSRMPPFDFFTVRPSPSPPICHYVKYDIG